VNLQHVYDAQETARVIAVDLPDSDLRDRLVTVIEEAQRRLITASSELLGTLDDIQDAGRDLRNLAEYM
jgi:hypothetical protein